MSKDYNLPKKKVTPSETLIRARQGMHIIIRLAADNHGANEKREKSAIQELQKTEFHRKNSKELGHGDSIGKRLQNPMFVYFFFLEKSKKKVSVTSLFSPLLG